MQKGLFILAIALALFSWPFVASSQAHLADTSFVEQAVADAVQSYKNSTGVQSHLYTGSEYYYIPDSYLDGHQFFKSKIFSTGSVQYDGVWYRGIPLLYDVVVDEVLTTHPTSGYILKLVKQKVRSFELGGETFIYLGADSSVIQPGYYSLLHSGKVKVLAFRDKEVQERTTTNGLEGEFRVTDKYYLYKDGSYHQVNKKRSVLNVLRDEKKQLNRFIRDNNLKFRKQKEAAITKVAQYYDTLKN
ncbi:hypothetical protein POKO110462_02935 [Pontibacter korlensis]|uniref:Uncharacterized protein n=1 Tax=Pontibacter korlensis TaxID=400092 RepID=A0A0E3UXI1_9BACT|nr:hypothetical protein [Pontibacter korlensis]AKD03596.1 hypothetical protein PKOR_11220 [Pontibacter korlensis]